MPKPRNSVDMTEGVIWKLLVQFALPMLIGHFCQQLYNMVDSVVVGRYVGKEALAAVGSTGHVINALIGFFSGLGMGGGVVISQYFGAKNDKGLHDAVHTTLLMTLLLGIFCTFFGILMTPYVLRWMSTPDDVIAVASQYLRIYFMGVSGMMVYNIGSGILRAVGDSKRPLYFLIFCALLNLALDLLFVCVFGMGVAGVAYATVISQALSAVMVLLVLTRSQGGYRLIPRDLRIDLSVLRRVLRIGLPAALQTSITSLSNVFVQAYINGFGSSCMAGWTMYSRLDAFAWMPMMCVGMASTTFVGQNLGAGNVARSKQGVRIAIRIAFACTALVVLVLMCFSRPLLTLFSTDADVLYYGRMFVLFLSPFYIPFCATQIYSGALRGAGDSLRPMLIIVGSFVVFRQLYLIIGTQFINSALFVAMGYPAGWIVSAVAMFLVYASGRWERGVQQVTRESVGEA